MNIRQALDLAVIALDVDADADPDSRPTAEQTAEAVRLLAALANTLSGLGL